MDDVFDIKNVSNFILWPNEYFPINLGQTRTFKDVECDSFIEEKIEKVIEDNGKIFYLQQTYFSFSDSYDSEWFCYSDNKLFRCSDDFKISNDPLLIFPFRLGGNWIDDHEGKVIVLDQGECFGKASYCLKYEYSKGAPPRIFEWYVRGMGRVKWTEDYQGYLEDYILVKFNSGSLPVQKDRIEKESD